MLLDWRKAMRRYRQLLTADATRGEPQARQSSGEAKPPGDATMIRKRIRHFTDGLVIGTKQFVNDAWSATRDRFGPNRPSGARRIRHVETALHAMRDLADPPAEAAPN
jgi:hypothetical protein